MVEAADIRNTAAPGTSYFSPHQDPPSGTAHAPSPPPKLFTPLKIRDVVFQNRIWLSPLCQYSAENGHMNAWHMAHLGGIISRGTGLAMIEATAVTPEGRISPEDVGIWQDSQAQAIGKVVDFAHSQSQKIGIQLAHGGRKASTLAPFLTHGDVATVEQGGWPDEVVGPSAVPYNSHFPKPKAMTIEQITAVTKAFADAAKRAVSVGIDVIEIHVAHGYLLHEFLSPVSNHRTDNYGGSFENRTRLPLEVVRAVRAAIPQETPLFLRISADDWVAYKGEPSWTIDEAVRLAPLLADAGIDLIDVSSGGISPEQKIPSGPAYQAPFAAKIRKALNGKALVSTVGTITNGTLAESLLQDGTADVVTVGRWFQKDPSLVWIWAEELGVEIQIASQISWAFGGHGGKMRAEV
jgi:2,4-dienoyl-CoA reductase-like NADH-dependent reductase (Old Yellow Enzyme family)